VRRASLGPTGLRDSLPRRASHDALISVTSRFNRATPKSHAFRVQASEQRPPRPFGLRGVVELGRLGDCLAHPARRLHTHVLGEEPAAVLDDRLVGFVVLVEHYERSGFVVALHRPYRRRHEAPLNAGRGGTGCLKPACGLSG
jgi:hypothetical protein